MDYKSLPELDNISELYKYELLKEAERLGVHVPSNATKSEVQDILEPYMDKKEYRKARSRVFCEKHDLQEREDLNANQRRKIERIFDGKTTHADEYGSSTLPYNIKKKK